MNRSRFCPLDLGDRIRKTAGEIDFHRLVSLPLLLMKRKGLTVLFFEFAVVSSPEPEEPYRPVKVPPDTPESKFVQGEEKWCQ